MMAIILGLLLTCIGVGAYIVVVKMVNSDNEDAIKRGEKQPVKVNKGMAVLGALVVILICTLLASLTKVSTGEIAVMTRFGRVTGQELGEGLHFKNPLDVANKYDIKVQKIEADAAAASKDLQDVHAHLVINYQIEPGKVSEIHRTVGVLYSEKLIDNAIQEVTKGATARFDATQLITDRPAVKAEAYNDLRARLNKYGIIVRDLSITNFSFSLEFSNAIEAKQVAFQQAEQAKYNIEKERANAQAAIESARGQAESQRLQQETLTPQYLQKLAIQTWDGKLPGTMAGGDTLFNIPLR